MKKKIIPFLLLLILIGVALFFNQQEPQTELLAQNDLFAQKSIEASKSTQAPDTSPEPPFLPEEPIKVPSETFAVIFKGLDRATISSKITTTVLKIPFKMGQKFKKGDLLILLDDTVYVGFKSKAEGNLSKAIAELAAKRQLYQENIASLFEIKTAEANFAIAKSDLISSQYMIDASHILAPYDGKVVAVFVEEYELIQEGKPLIEIVNDTQLIGQVLADVKILQLVHLNQVIPIFVQELNETVEGKVFRIDAVIDPASSTFKIDILVDNKMDRLRPGMIGMINFDQISQEKRIMETPGANYDR